MGRKNRERVAMIRRGLVTSIRDQRGLEFLESLTDQYGGQLVAEEIHNLAEAETLGLLRELKS